MNVRLTINIALGPAMAVLLDRITKQYRENHEGLGNDMKPDEIMEWIISRDKEAMNQMAGIIGISMVNYYEFITS